MHAQILFSARRLGLYGLALLALVGMWPGVASAQQIEERVNIGDVLTLSAGGRNIKEALAVRAGVVRIEPIDDKNPTVVKVTAVRLGRTRIILTDENNGQVTFNVVVSPDLGLIRDAMKKEFPTSNIEVHAGIAGQLIVSGTVNSSEDLDPLIKYLAAFANGDVKNVINNIRVIGVSQIQLEVCLAAVTRSEARNLAVNFLTADQQNFFTSTFAAVVPNSAISPIIRATPGFTTFSGGSVFPVSSANLNFALTGTNSAFLGLIQALRSEAVTKILANPSAVVLSGRIADFNVGGEAPFGTAGSGGGTGSGISFRPFGTRIQFLPVILGDGKIRLDIHAEISNIDPALSFNGGGVVAPGFDERKIDTTIEMESGQTFALGGIIQNTVTGTAVKVPVLGDVPFFGTLFRQVSYNEVEEELVIIVTPRLVDPMDCGQMKSKLPGQETRSPTDFELFLEGIVEAPRGPRELCPDGQYRPAHWWTPNGGRCYPAGACGNTTGGANCVSCGSQVMPMSNGKLAEVQAMPPAPTATVAPAPASQPRGISKMPLTAEPMPTVHGADGVSEQNPVQPIADSPERQ
jgi:pilus assembly protein CpaC